MIRPLKPSDKEALQVVINSISSFNDDDKKVAMELVDIAVSNPNQQDYNFFLFEEDNIIYGYHCTGRRPLTDGVYDLYWIVVASNAAGKGVGTQLIEHAQQFVKEKKGRWLLAETSSKDSYEATRKFYFKNGFSIIAQINDFYSVNEKLLIFGKYFNNN